MMKTGLDVLLENVEQLKGKNIGVCCNHTAIDQNLQSSCLKQMARSGDVLGSTVK